MEDETAISAVANGNAVAVAASKPKPPASGQGTNDVFGRAKKSDESCLPQVRASFDDGEFGRALRESAGSPVEWLRRSLTEKAAEKTF